MRSRTQDIGKPEGTTFGVGAFDFVSAEVPERRAVTGIRRVVRGAVSVALILSGAGMVAYGVMRHQVPVLAEKVELKAPPPSPAPPPGVGGDPFLTAVFGAPPPAPGPPPAPVKQVRTLVVVEAEPKIMFEVMIGGVTRALDGRIRRTYRDKPPSECPT